jgi:DNA processing protein
MAKGIHVLWPGAQGYPAQLNEHVSPPPGVLFVAGDLATLSHQPSVAIIGSRQCTSDGAATAFEMAQDLAHSGVCVVSGLASGIDGAAHAGAVSAMLGVSGATAAKGMTVGVAASGVDVVYPARNAQLWRQVTTLGAVVSETPPGTPAQSWRFPTRNRIIAGLVNMVVVVECHIKSGSWHTVDAALSSNVHVAAVPGPVRSSTSRGNNEMLARGAAFVRHANDVLEYLGAAVPGSADASGGASWPALEGIGPLEREALAALSHRPLCVDDVVERSGLPVGAVVVALDHLVKRGLAIEQQGWWSRARAPGR